MEARLYCSNCGKVLMLSLDLSLSPGVSHFPGLHPPSYPASEDRTKFINAWQLALQRNPGQAISITNWHIPLAEHETAIIASLRPNYICLGTQ